MKVLGSVVDTICKARLKVAAGEQERAKALIDEALVIMDAVLYAKSGTGWPKAKLWEIRGHIAEAAFAVVRSDFSRASSRLDEAIRALEQSKE